MGTGRRGTTPAELRSLALALPEAVEQDHHGIPSYRVRGRVFATMPDDAHVRVLVDEDQVRELAASEPDRYAPFWWGKRLACVVAELAVVPPDEVAELLADAWARKAPAALRRDHAESMRDTQPGGRYPAGSHPTTVRARTHTS